MSRPSYIPDTWDWWPGEDAGKIGVKVREGWASDYYSVRGLLPGLRYDKWQRWCSWTGYSVWVATRNGRNVVGLIVYRIIAGNTSILRYATNPHRDKMMLGMLGLALYEMPENPVTWTFPLTEASRLKVLRDNGWKVVGSSDEDGTTTMCHESRVRF